MVILPVFSVALPPATVRMSDDVPRQAEPSRGNQ